MTKKINLIESYNYNKDITVELPDDMTEEDFNKLLEDIPVLDTLRPLKSAQTVLTNYFEADGLKVHQVTSDGELESVTYEVASYEDLS